MAQAWGSRFGGCIGGSTSLASTVGPCVVTNMFWSHVPKKATVSYTIPQIDLKMITVVNLGLII